MRPAEETTTTTSGSGLLQLDTGFSPASMPLPTAAMICDLVKISASGPMPTSRYCDHAPFSINTAFSCIASGDPARSFDRSLPISVPMVARISTAASGLPRARSSITRSSIDVAKVTPAAFSACRSTGANSHGRDVSRISTGVFAMMASTVPRLGPVAARAAAPGSAASHRSRMVGKDAVMSISWPPSRLTMLGPATAGFQARPTSKPSAGRAAAER